MPHLPHLSDFRQLVALLHQVPVHTTSPPPLGGTPSDQKSGPQSDEAIGALGGGQEGLQQGTFWGEQVQLVPVYRRLTSDTLTPVLAFARLAGETNTPACLFESVIGGEKVGRYSFLAVDPLLELEAHHREVLIRRYRPQQATPHQQRWASEDPLSDLEKLVAKYQAKHLFDLPPFCGGAVGYAGYDTVRYSERLPNAPGDDRNLPDLAFALYDSMVVFDHITKTVLVIALADVSQPGQADSAYSQAAARVDQLVARLNGGQLPSSQLASSQLSSDQSSGPLLEMADIQTTGEVTLEWTSNFRQDQFEEAVNRCLEYIRAGDIFQVVLSQRLQTPLTVPAFEIYRTLRVVNPSPFMFYVRHPTVTLVGSSPEILVRVVEGRITVRPLAGTRPRGATEAEDRRLAEELLADPKERAEHVMLVDLGRNDVGRVACYGSINLSDVMVIERYSHVMHITSNVTGQLTEDRTAFDALRACLPAGTVSGAPKVRAMEIIDELEPHRRGPYAGAVGYIDFSGNMDTCIALRTMVVHNQTISIQAGAGIVADSDPATEYQETLNKARGLLKAVELTQRRVQAQSSLPHNPFPKKKYSQND